MDPEEREKGKTYVGVHWYGRKRGSTGAKWFEKKCKHRNFCNENSPPANWEPNLGSICGLAMTSDDLRTMCNGHLVVRDDRQLPLAGRQSSGSFSESNKFNYFFFSNSKKKQSQDMKTLVS